MCAACDIKGDPIDWLLAVKVDAQLKRVAFDVDYDENVGPKIKHEFIWRSFLT